MPTGRRGAKPGQRPYMRFPARVWSVRLVVFVLADLGVDEMIPAMDAATLDLWGKVSSSALFPILSGAASMLKYASGPFQASSRSP